MKLKINKDAFGYKANTEVEVGDVEAKTLVDGGFAVEVKEDANAVIEKATSEIATRLDNQDKAIAAMTATVAKALKGVSKASRSDITVIGDRVDGDPQAGFKGVGDYLACVIRASKGLVDPRLDRINKTAPQNETTAADGGNAVPVQYADFLYQDIMEDQENLLNRSFKQPITVGNMTKIPADNTTVLGQNGITASVVGEGVQMTDSKAATRQITLVPRKLSTLVDVTEELMADTNVALPAYLQEKTKLAFDWKINNDFLFGKASAGGNTTDVGDGVVGHAATVQVLVAGAEYSAGGIAYEDLLAMRAAFYGNRKEAVWIMGPDTEVEVMQVQDGAGRNLYFPPGGLQNQPYGTLFGIPVLISYHSATFNNTGDIILGDWSKYVVGLRGGIDSASTPFLHFDQQLMTFRTVFRLIGRPARDATLNSGKYGNFVTLQTRL